MGGTGTARTALWTAVAIALCGCGGGGGGTGRNTTRGPSNSLVSDSLAVDGHSPADGAVQVALDASIVADFDGVIAQECLQEPDTWLKADGTGTAVPGSFRIESGGTRVRFVPDQPLAAETDYVFQLSALTCDVDARLLEEDHSFGFRTLDATAPSVASANVAEGAVGVDRGATFLVVFDERIDPVSVTSATAYLRDVYGTDFVLSARVDGAALTLDPRVDLPGDRTFVLVLAGGGSGVTDRAGNPLAVSWSVRFRTGGDPTAPALVGGWPAGGSGMSPDVAPELTFDESMDPYSFEAAAARLVDQFANVVSIGLDGDPSLRRIRLVPKAPLWPGRSYTLTLLSGPGAVTDLSGNPLAAPGTFTFSVGSDADPPALVGASVGAGATGVSPNAEPTLTFDGALDPLRATEAVVGLSTAGSTVEIDLALEDGGRRIRIVPVAGLAPSTTYAIRVRSGADGLRDAAGNLLDSDLERTFTTSADPDLPGLLVLPIDGSVTVARDTVVTVIADAPLAPESVSAATVEVRGPGGAEVDGTLTLGRNDRVIRFTPAAPWAAGSTYTVAVLGGPDGVRKASGNWLTDSLQQTFRAAGTLDTTPPVVRVTVNDIDRLRNGDLCVPPFGFSVDVAFLDPDVYAQDPGSVVVDLRGPVDPLDAERVFATAEVTWTGLRFTVPEDQALAPGAWELSAHVRDLSGNLGSSSTLRFRVDTYSDDVLPFERTQVVWTRFDLDRDGNGRGDFEDDMLRLGFATEGDPAGTNARVLGIVRDGILAQAHRLFLRRQNGGRDGADSIALRLTWRQPLGVPSMQIACGGFDPEGTGGRSYGDDSSGTLGRAFFDYRNGRVNDNNVGTNPGLGVFPAELFLFEAAVHQQVYPSFVTTFARRFLAIAPAMGGTPAGSHPLDATVLAPGFDYQAGSSPQKARYNAVFRAADDWAVAIGSILAHEIGHAVGLVASGRTSLGLHGDATLHDEFPGITDVMSSAVGYDGLVSLDFEFRDITTAYMRHRVILK